MQNKLAWARMLNAEGKTVPTPANEFTNEKKVSEAFKKISTGSGFKCEVGNNPGMNVLLANQKEQNHGL